MSLIFKDAGCYLFPWLEIRLGASHCHSGSPDGRVLGVLLLWLLQLVCFCKKGGWRQRRSKRSKQTDTTQMQTQRGAHSPGLIYFKTRYSPLNLVLLTIPTATTLGQISHLCTSEVSRFILCGRGCPGLSRMFSSSLLSPISNSGVYPLDAGSNASNPIIF